MTYTHASPKNHTQRGSVVLADLPLGVSARIVRINGGRSLARRLMGLGLRVGAEIQVVQRRGRGLVIAKGDNRVALGSSVTNLIHMDLIH